MMLFTKKNALYYITEARVVMRDNAICIITQYTIVLGKGPFFSLEVGRTVRAKIFLNKWTWFLIYSLFTSLPGIFN